MTTTFRRAAQVAELGGLSDEALTARLFGGQRGPSSGNGRGAGRPWGGIVEETPALWVTWFVAAAKRLGRPVPAAILIDGKRVDFVSVRLTFGPRWYFACPRCGRRCEAIYVMRGASGCRQCLRLGYKSQAQRATSVWAALDVLFDRDGWRAARYAPRDDVIGGIAGELRKGLQAEIRAMLARVTVPGDPAPAGECEG